jgi:hypothetical protein
MKGGSPWNLSSRFVQLSVRRGANLVVTPGSGPRQEIFTLSLADGSIEPDWPLDVATALGGGFDPSVQNQRGALALFKGKIFVPFSGHWGDCGAYHGFVVGVSIDEPGKVTSFSSLARGGGIWAQGGVSGDGQSLFAVTGNTFGTTGWFGATEWSDGEAVLRPSPDLVRPIESRDYFAPRIGATSIVATSTSAGPRRSRLMS